MKNNYQSVEAIGIIGGADGPTSVLINDKKRKKSLKSGIRNYIYRRKRKKAARKIVAGAHSLEELLIYAVGTYGATEVTHKLGEISSISCVYEIKMDRGHLDIEIDDARETFGVSFSGNKKVMKYFQAIVRDLYIYYGVSESDITNKTERYLALLGVLSL